MWVVQVWDELISQKHLRISISFFWLCKHSFLPKTIKITTPYEHEHKHCSLLWLSPRYTILLLQILTIAPNVDKPGTQCSVLYICAVSSYLVKRKLWSHRQLGREGKLESIERWTNTLLFGVLLWDLTARVRQIYPLMDAAPENHLREQM